MPSTVANQPAPRLQMESTYNGPLSPVQMEVIALLVEGGRTMEQLAQEVGWDRQTIWRWRKKPEFQAEYLKQLRAVEQQALDYGVSRRVERIAALNDTWLKLKTQIAKTRTPRTDHIYALIALQSAAAKEMGQDAQRLEIGGHLAITQAVQVIHFEALPPRNDLEGEILEATFAETPADPEPTDAFDHALASAGVPSGPGRLDPEYEARLKAVIEESGADPASVLSREQFAALYGQKEKDPWTH